MHTNDHDIDAPRGLHMPRGAVALIAVCAVALLAGCGEADSTSSNPAPASAAAPVSAPEGVVAKAPATAPSSADSADLDVARLVTARAIRTEVNVKRLQVARDPFSSGRPEPSSTSSSSKSSKPPASSSTTTSSSSASAAATPPPAAPPVEVTPIDTSTTINTDVTNVDVTADPAPTTYVAVLRMKRSTQKKVKVVNATDGRLLFQPHPAAVVHRIRSGERAYVELMLLAGTTVHHTGAQASAVCDDARDRCVRVRVQPGHSIVLRQTIGTRTSQMTARVAKIRPRR